MPTENYPLYTVDDFVSLASCFVTLEKPADAVYTFLESLAFLQNPVP